MNFLAHLFLSCERESLMVGNFLADFIRNRDVLLFPGPVIEGIYLHRKIDSYTDNHPVVRQGVRRFYPYHRKYASVVIDVLYDYFLAKNWHLYTDQPLPEFAAQVYEGLLRHIEIMPQSLQQQLQLMIKDDWLMNYTHYEGLEYTFQRLQKRVSKPEQIKGVIGSLQKHEEEIDKEFQLFFPEVIVYVREECLC